jgi:hypothetical protein
MQPTTLFSNSLKLPWPEGLMVAIAVAFLVGMKIVVVDDFSVNPIYVRMLSFVGVLATSSLVLLGIWPSLYTILAVPVVPAPFAFVFLIFRPSLISKWRRMRLYLTVCVVISACAWTIQFIWLSTR